MTTLPFITEHYLANNDVTICRAIDAKRILVAASIYRYTFVVRPDCGGWETGRLGAWASDLPLTQPDWSRESARNLASAEYQK